MIGNSNEPGVTSSVTSALSVSTSGPSPGTPVIVGGADLSGSDSATAGEVYSVADSSEAQTLFGKNSRLTKNILDALNMGAEPVIAVAPPETTESKDLSSLGSSEGSLSNPAKEDVDDITVTVDSSDKTVSLVFKDVANYTVESGEAVLNPTTNNFKLDSAPSSSGSFEYTALDYSAALDAVEAYSGDVDFAGTLTELSSVTSDLLGTANAMENEYKFALAVAGIPFPIDPDGFTNDYDTSRLKLIAPTRTQDGSSLIGAYLGLRSNLGLTATPINQQIPLRDRPIVGLDSQDRGTLIDKNVTPLERIGESVRVTDDVTTVSESNTEEQNYKYSFSRLVVDFLIETVNELEKPFVGKFNSPGAIGQLEDLLNKEARPLSNSNVIYEHEASVTMIDPTTAKVTFNADVAEPIRFIDNDFVIGNNLNLQSV